MDECHGIMLYVGHRQLFSPVLRFFPYAFSSQAWSLPAFLRHCLQSLLACTLPSSAMRSRSVGVLSNSYYLPLNFLPAPHRSVTFLCFGLYACSLVC